MIFSESIKQPQEVGEEDLEIHAEQVEKPHFELPNEHRHAGQQKELDSGWTSIILNLRADCGLPKFIG